MAKLTGSEFAEKWARRLSGATEDIAKGVARVTEAPGKKAAQKKDKWVARLTSPETVSKWANNISAVSLSDWQTALVQKGLPRLSTGCEAAKRKQAEFGEKLLSYQDAGIAKIQAMPDLSLADTKNRMIAWFDYMSKFRK